MPEKTKTCYRCGEKLPATTDYFYRNNQKEDGLRHICKDCFKQDSKRWKRKGPEETPPIGQTEITKICSTCGRELPATLEYYFKEKFGQYGLRSKCKDCFIAKSNEWKRANPEKEKEIRRRLWQRHREEYTERMRQQYWEDPDYHRERARRWIRENPEKAKETWKRTDEKRRADPRYRISDAISRGIRQSLKVKGQKRRRHWEEIVGYTLDELIVHLEHRFKSGMSWDNFGEWHPAERRWNIDHIRPIASFSFTSPDDAEFRECWALENLQPLWARENLSKGPKLDWEEEE